MLSKNAPRASNPEQKSNTNNESMTQSKRHVLSMSASSSSGGISVAHRFVTQRVPYIGLRKCFECRKFLIYYAMKKENIYMCQVCGIRVHEGCLHRISNNCLVTSQYVGGLVQSAIIRSNKKKWDPCQSSSTPHSPVSDENSGTVNKYKFEEDEEEKMMTWEDVTICREDIEVKGKIESGRFGDVYYGLYHGDAAVKYVNMKHVEEEKRIDVFKNSVVSAYKNSRHNHIALFLGYFIDPLIDQYAIVMNFYHGRTLHHLIHESNEEIDVPWLLDTSLHICQAMSYLHKKEILHKDLSTKNIMMNKSNKVFVADFGLLNMDRLAIPKRNYTLLVPTHWLDYVAPEIASNLMVSNDNFIRNDLPFSRESDVYSFGTVFFELLMRKMPSENLPWEVKIYEKIIGSKTAVNKFDAQKNGIDVKYSKILMNCWSTEPKSRPAFASVVRMLTSVIRQKEITNSARSSVRCFESAF